MTPLPVLSICIPTYNRSGLLLNLLNDMDRPDYLLFPFEVVVSDNASTDPGYATIAAYEPKHYAYRYYRRPANIGGEANMVACYRLGRGLYVLHLADDDRLIPQGLSDIVLAMLDDPALIATYAAFQMHDEAVDQAHGPRNFEEARADRQSISELAQRMVGWPALIPENGVFRAHELTHAFFPTGIGYFSYPILRRLLGAGDIRFAASPFYRVITRHRDEAALWTHYSSRLGFTGWGGMARGFEMFHHWATGQRVVATSGDPAGQVYRMLLRNSFIEASNTGLAFEALEIAEFLYSLSPDEALDTASDTRLRTLAWIFGVCAVADSLPGVRRLALMGTRASLKSLFQQTLTLQRSAITLDEKGAETTQGDLVVVTATEAQRAALLASSTILAGYTFSVEALERAFAW
jgi:glycosyltransferase involved in cell wall biosynthesis